MEQILNNLLPENPRKGLLEKLVSGDELSCGESAVSYSIGALRGSTAVPSHTNGHAISDGGRGVDFQLNFRLPDYKTRRVLSPDEIYSRINATAGMDEVSAMKKILEKDIKQLEGDIVVSIEKQVASLLQTCTVDYEDDTSTQHTHPCYSGSTDPTAATMTTLISSDAMAAIDELVEKCQSAGFQPDVLVLGSAAVKALLADDDFQLLGKNNDWKPEIIELDKRDGGSFVGRVGTPHGASIEIYACNESDGANALIGAKTGIMMQSGFGTGIIGRNAFASDGEGFEVQGQRLGLAKRREGIDQALYMASRVCVVPSARAFIHATVCA